MRSKAHKDNVLNKEHIKEIALEAGGSHYPEVGGDTLLRFAKLLIEACIDAVENTSTTHAYTTYDKGVIDATIDKSAQAIRDKFDLPLIRKLPHENSSMFRSTSRVSGSESNQ